MMEKESKVRWGNWMGYVLLPISIALEDDPLDYIRKAKATIDRKKLSFEAICSFSVGRLILDLFGLKVLFWGFLNLYYHTPKNPFFLLQDFLNFIIRLPTVGSCSDAQNRIKHNNVLLKRGWSGGRS